MTTIDADALRTHANTIATKDPAQPSARSIGLGHQISIVIMGLAAAIFSSGTFTVLTLGLFAPLANMIGLPRWFIIALALPLLALSVTVAVWMFVKTVQVERQLALYPNSV